MPRPSQPASRTKLPQRHRLKKKSEFKAVYEHGLRVSGRIINLWALPCSGATRVAFVAGRRVGGAVARNRAKRLMREAYRLNRERLAGSYQLVLVARSGGRQAGYREVEAELVNHLCRAGCLDRPRSRGGRRGRRHRGTRS